MANAIAASDAVRTGLAGVVTDRGWRTRQVPRVAGIGRNALGVRGTTGAHTLDTDEPAAARGEVRQGGPIGNTDRSPRAAHGSGGTRKSLRLAGRTTREAGSAIADAGVTARSPVALWSPFVDTLSAGRRTDPVTRVARVGGNARGEPGARPGVVQAAVRSGVRWPSIELAGIERTGIYRPDKPGVRSAGVGSAGVGSAGVGSAGVGSAGVGSAGVGSAGVGTAGVGTAGVGSAGVGSAGVGSARIRSARIKSAGVGSAGVGSAGVGSAGVGSAGVGSARIRSAGVGSAGVESFCCSCVDGTCVDRTCVDKSGVGLLRSSRLSAAA
jgi:hypothetical protein